MHDRFGNPWWHEEGRPPPRGSAPPRPPNGGAPRPPNGGAPHGPNTSKQERAWTIMKSARFNAAKRFERKHSASTLSFAVAGIVGFLVPVYPLIFVSTISLHAEHALEFTSFVTGALSITLGLYDVGKNYPEKARQFHECGKAINRVVRKLGDGASPNIHLGHLIAEYEAAIDGCQDNHDPIDYDIAKAQWDLKSAQGESAARIQRHLRSLRWWQWLETCWLYGAIWLAPPAAGVLIYWLAPASAAGV